MEIYCMHLKRDDYYMRKQLIDYCLNNGVLAFGWSFLHDPDSERLSNVGVSYTINTMQDYLACAWDYYKNQESEDGTKKKVKKFNPVFNCFAGVNVDDIVWTRDLDGNYYVCRILECPKPHFEPSLDIGAVVKADIQKVGINVPGTIVHRFSNSHSPTIQRIANEYEKKNMLAYSCHCYNELSGEKYYPEVKTEQDLFQLLDGFDLEELVLDYLQIKYNYYLCKNSVARGDTTIKIECDLYPRTEGLPSAVVQVKGGKKGNPAIASEYMSYVNAGKKVFLFFSNENYGPETEGIEFISKKELQKFAFENCYLLPPAITNWIDICKK